MQRSVGSVCGHRRAGGPHGPNDEGERRVPVRLVDRRDLGPDARLGARGVWSGLRGVAAAERQPRRSDRVPLHPHPRHPLPALRLQPGLHELGGGLGHGRRRIGRISRRGGPGPHLLPDVVRDGPRPGQLGPRLRDQRRRHQLDRARRQPRRHQPQPRLEPGQHGGHLHRLAGHAAALRPHLPGHQLRHRRQRARRADLHRRPELGDRERRRAAHRAVRGHQRRPLLLPARPDLGTNRPASAATSTAATAPTPTSARSTATRATTSSTSAPTTTPPSSPPAPTTTTARAPLPPPS